MVDTLDIILKVLLFGLSLLWWVFLPIFLFFITTSLWVKTARQKSIEKISWVLLEIKPPQDFKKTPKSMEQIFFGLHGFQSNPNWWEKSIKGKVQDWFSFELIADSGEIKFLIRTPAVYRNFVESQIYAQYPEAEIAQLDDYVNTIPKEAPNPDFDLWGTELVLTADDAYPIKTYLYFERDVLSEDQRIDPLASLSEILSNTHDGERIWIQTLIRPIDHSWKKSFQKEKDKLLGRKKKKKPSIIGQEISAWGEATTKVLFGSEPTASGDKKEDSDKTPNMTQVEREAVTAIEQKMAKVGYETIIRFLYLAPTSVFSKANAGGVIGCYKQFSDQNLNGFKPNGKITSKIDYGIQLKKPREFSRKKKILAAYQSREFVAQSRFVEYLKPLFIERLPILNKFFIKSQPFILNAEELATIWHFPGIVVEAPTISRVQAKRSEPPVGLPVE